MEVRAASVMEVNLDNIVFNYNTVCDYVRPAAVIPVLKGNAYGHGAVAIARALIEAGCRHLAVAKLSEALELRRAGIQPEQVNVIIMTTMLPEEIDVAIDHNFSFFLPDFWSLDYLKQTETRRTRPARFYVKVDTGMGRMGFMPDQAHALAAALKRMANYRLEGFATHLHAATQEEESERQRRRFEEFLAAVRPPAGCLVHMASSSAVARFPHLIKNAVRVGDLIYGLCAVDNPPFALRPALSYRSKVIQVKNLPSGWHIGYGTNQRVVRPIKTATAPIGTGDGLMTSQVNRAFLLVRGKRCRLLAACADSAIIDASLLPSVAVGDEVVYIGSQGDETLTAREQALSAGTGFSELLSKISLRTPRIYIKEGKYAGEMSYDRRDGIACCPGSA